MSLEGKNKRVFSYTNHDVRNKNFLNKDFNKTQSYHSNFSNSSFENTSFLGTKFKFCAFYSSKFSHCDFSGTLFRRCNLTNATFERAILKSTSFENCQMRNIVFKNCYILGKNIQKRYPNIDFTQSYIIENLPSTNEFDASLIEVVQTLRVNDFIRRSKVLHLKENKLNTLALLILKDKFSEEQLRSLLPQLPNVINNQFYTLSYLEKMLLKLDA